uniref:substrate binding domain-containing protein n=1 Tax=Inquilinus sp. OTU3971 TaxID=3043855 RepID=UPI00313C447D
MFGPYLLDFAAQHPDLVMDLRLTNGTPDLVEEGIDLAFQLGPLPDGRHVARKLWPVRYALCASLPFVKRYPDVMKLTHPRQLTTLPCILTPPLESWHFERDGEGDITFVPEIIGAKIEDLALGAVAAGRGLGLGYLPESLVAGRSSDAFVSLNLGGWRPRARDLFAVYPRSRQLSPKVRAAIDHAVAGRDWYKQPREETGSMTGRRGRAAMALQG